jgi:cytoskeletal protein RodZ
MASVGEKLRKARLDRGLDLSQVAEQTKIGSRYLDAIERDDRSSLPGGFFYKNWVQQYAGCLSLDIAAITADVDRTVAQDVEPALPGQGKQQMIREQRIAPVDIPGANLGGAASRLLAPVAVLICVVLGCSGFYVWWRNSQNPTTVAESSNPPQTAPAEPSASVPPSTIPVEPMVKPASAPEASPTPPAIAPESATKLTPISPDDVQIEISATQATWISVTPDGKQVFAGILQPAEVRTLGAHDTALIRIGNAGGLSVRLNGKSIGPIGPAGQVRTLIINKSGFQIVEPKPAAPANEAPSPDRAPIAPLLD